MSGLIEPEGNEEKFEDEKPQDKASDGVIGDAPELTDDEWNDMFYSSEKSIHSFKIEDQELEDGFNEIESDKDNLKTMARTMRTKIREMMSEIQYKKAELEHKKHYLNNVVAERFPDDHKKLGEHYETIHKPDGVYMASITNEEVKEKVKAKVKEEVSNSRKAIAFAIDKKTKENRDKFKTSENALVPLSVEEQELLIELESLGVDVSDTDKWSEMGADWMRTTIGEVKKKKERDAKANEDSGEPGNSQN
jgi:hypothetical protein